jgi:PilZ domain
VDFRSNAPLSTPSFSRRIARNRLIIKALSNPLVAPSGIPDACIRTSSLVPRRPDHLKIDVLKKGQLVDSSSTRRSPRIRLQVPIFLRGTDVSGAEFIELTKTLNISSTGACITSTHVLRPDQTVHITIPTPAPTSSSLVPSETPPIVARVLRQESAGEMRLFGLEFLRTLE